VATHRSPIPAAPAGWRALTLLGPGFLWMVSAAGSGELLFTPRMGALYGYQLLWMLLIAVTLKWFINREIGRFAVCSGRNLIAGFADLPGPRLWAVWVILVPQLFVAVTAIAGLAGSAATAVVLAMPGDVRIWMIVLTCSSTALVVWGRYKKVERTATIIAVALAGASIAAAITVSPDPAEMAAGLTPRIPAGVDFGEVLPWLGFMLSGAAGLIWYSFWVVAKPYGAAAADGGKTERRTIDGADARVLRGWVRVMTLDCTIAVVGTLIITIAFLVLGTELLGPRRLVPEENRVAEVLGHLLGGVWGRAGYWFMIVGVFIGFWDTVLSDQDGHGRMFAAGIRLALLDRGLRGRWTDEAFLQRLIVIALVTVLPILTYLIIGQPVDLLKIAGAIEAAHIPLVTALVLFLNRRTLPPSLRPSWITFGVTAVAGAFFAVFAGLYIVGFGS
jgi:Mn2+/Fe2+ NRAMP family transporter